MNNNSFNVSLINCIIVIDYSVISGFFPKLNSKPSGTAVIVVMNTAIFYGRY